MSVEYSEKSTFSAETFSKRLADHGLWSSRICLIHLESPCNINIDVNKHFVNVRKIPRSEDTFSKTLKFAVSSTLTTSKCLWDSNICHKTA